MRLSKFRNNLERQGLTANEIEKACAEKQRRELDSKMDKRAVERMVLQMITSASGKIRLSTLGPFLINKGYAKETLVPVFTKISNEKGLDYSSKDIIEIFTDV